MYSVKKRRGEKKDKKGKERVATIETTEQDVKLKEC